MSRFVYVAEGPDGLVKIGSSREPERRLISLQSQYKCVLVYSCEVPETLAFHIERRAQWFLLNSHVKGEWFRINSIEAIAAVEQAVNDNGEGERFFRGRSPFELINARVPEGTGKRMDRVLKGGELRSAFVRAAIEAELQRRERRSAERAQ